jgi:hypothetical protein
MIDTSLKNEAQNPAYRPAFFFASSNEKRDTSYKLATRVSRLAAQKKEILLAQDLFFHLY